MNIPLAWCIRDALQGVTSAVWRATQARSNAAARPYAPRKWYVLFRKSPYMAKALAGQLKSGDPYEKLKPVIGIHLLGFDLFPEPDQALWCFEMRDQTNPLVRLGSELQLNIIELRKADRLSRAGKLPRHHAQAATGLNAWVLYFQHWKDEGIMNQIEYPPVKEAVRQLRVISADDETRRLAELRERALRSERTEIGAAVRRGVKIGEERGVKIGEERGVKIGEERGVRIGKEEAVKSLMKSGMTEVQARSLLGM